ncbi:Ankyrin repeats (3 copies) [Legionella massiliensis]|uniref:Ankyrin repeats (3 copies) n=1 Tax=Legionella massiliensis TaxID=1034943 RepID=A0A078L0A1_9GAMM|nr:ankyrin repeat domain-containing protein [Legionella massiliensis]CDZ78581.1 Ankyrin repeats (3 copies) [Legionella massiliensis]CEE14319.1 Ankyrin repeats (3 copies) [Legionella massiliensis]
MRSKREPFQSSQARGKRQRATTSASRILSNLASSSSSNSSSARAPRDWEKLGHNHFPSSYDPLTRKTSDGWKTHYLRMLSDTAKALDTPEEGQKIKALFTKLFSLENIDLSTHALDEADKALLLMQIIRVLNNLHRVASQKRLINLAALVHHRLPKDLASELFTKAIAWYQENQALEEQRPLTPLYWALICRQPISRELITKSLNNNRLLGKFPNIFQLATGLNDLEFIKSLMIHGLYIDRCDRPNCIVAINFGFIDVLNFFLTLPDESLITKDNLLNTALRKGNIEIVDRLLEKNNIEINGKKTLLSAAKLANANIIRKILARDASGSIEALEEAIREQNTVSIDALFEGGVHVGPDCQSELITEELAKRAQMNLNILKRADPQAECFDEDTIIDFLKGRLSGLCSMPIGYTPDGIYFFEDALNGSAKAVNFLIASDHKTPMVLKPFFHDTEDRLSYRLLALAIVSDRLSRAGWPIVLKEEEKHDLCRGDLASLSRIISEYPADVLQAWLNELAKAPETASFHLVCQTLIKQIERFELAELLKELEYLDPESFENVDSPSLPSSSQQKRYGLDRFFKRGGDKLPAEESLVSCSSSSSSSSSISNEDRDSLGMG